MNPHAQVMIENSRRWLKEDVLPLWSERGVDASNGAFVEALSHQGEPLSLARRTMVQARQIYSFVEAARMGFWSQAHVAPVVRKAATFMIDKMSLTSGAFVHAVEVNGQVSNSQLDLYSQAFALFGLAHAYGVTHEVNFKVRALKVLDYLQRERALPAGGFSEQIGGKTSAASNPHMHLFEAALAWMAVDPAENQWSKLASGVRDLCETRFIDAQTGALGEHFDLNWKVERMEGQFVFEPGHQYEWAWLFTQHAQLTQTPASEHAERLFSIAEQFGVDAHSKLAFDEVWSGGQVKKNSSRFWPQGERIKAAVALGAKATQAQQPSFAKAADQACVSLFRYFENLRPGLWQDTLSADGHFVEQPVKASSLYHIINALSEYVRLRPLLKDDVL